jgi:hypothetical protein
MAIKLEDGTQATVQQLLSGDAQDPKGSAITFSQVGSSNTYTATVALNDGSGRNQIYSFDKPGDSGIVVTVSRKVQ